MSKVTKIIIALVIIVVLVWWYMISVPNTSQVKPVTAPAASSPALQVSSSPVSYTLRLDSTNKFITDSNGRTLYVKAGESGASTCYSSCALNWPPLKVSESPAAGSGINGTISTISRTDGIIQVTYNGKPLYYYARDNRPGDTNGDGVGGVWSVARP